MPVRGHRDVYYAAQQALVCVGLGLFPALIPGLIGTWAGRVDALSGRAEVWLGAALALWLAWLLPLRHTAHGLEAAPALWIGGLLWLSGALAAWRGASLLPGWGDGLAWLLTVGLMAFALILVNGLGHGRPFWQVVLLAGSVGLLVGLILVGLEQVETRFSEEEFFVLLNAGGVALVWLALWAASLARRRWTAAPAASHTLLWRLDGRLAAFLGLALAGAFGAGVLTAYQASFFPPSAPTFAGISDEQPWICGYAAPETEQFDGRAVLRELAGRVSASVRQTPAELGFLALSRLALGETEVANGQAEAFRQAILTEARAARLTGPAQSVKYIQYQAALRAYYTIEVQRAFPQLFSTVEQAELAHWYGQINRRALTVEWVDWLYGLAFGRWPQGPYANQDNGAGLLALLEAGKLADPALRDANQTYLTDTQRGWESGFRNTDDAVFYQAEWMDNAMFQADWAGQADARRQSRSYEWLLIQALPDGAPLAYNHPLAAPLAGAMYQGANLTGDGRFLWLAGRSATTLAARGISEPARPGAERIADGTSTAPDIGSCLVYGDSGLPGQPGPLAPDKVVLRGGWGADDLYILLNLRFSGWHRYKATNTISLVYQAGALVDELAGVQRTDWLPEGRSLWRDKRIDREALNGLVVGRSGLAWMVDRLAPFGSPWAQDPPFYAEPIAFRSDALSTSSVTVMSNWRGWTHRRQVEFFADGLAVVIDQAHGPGHAPAELRWHLTQTATMAVDGRFELRNGPQPVEMALLPFGGGQLQTHQLDNAGLLIDASDGSGRLNLATVFLSGAWLGAQVELETAGGQASAVVIRQGEMERRVVLAVNP